MIGSKLWYKIPVDGQSRNVKFNFSAPQIRVSPSDNVRLTNLCIIIIIIIRQFSTAFLTKMQIF